MKPKAQQQEFGFTRHGGKRKGAGRKPKGAKAGVAHDRRVRFRPYQPLMVTLRLSEGLRSLRADKEHALVLAASRTRAAHGSRTWRARRTGGARLA